MKTTKPIWLLLGLLLLISMAVMLMRNSQAQRRDSPIQSQNSQQDALKDVSPAKPLPADPEPIAESGSNSDDPGNSPASGAPPGLLLPSQVVGRVFPKVDLEVLASRLTRGQFAVFERIRKEFPEVDWTEIEPTHQAFLTKRAEFPLNLNDQQREAYAAWLAEVEPMSRELISLRAQAHGLSPGGKEDGRDYYIDGFRDGKPVYVVTANAGAAITTGASYVRWNPGGFDATLASNTINGSEFYVTIYDGGEIREHTEFQLPNAGGSRIVTKETGAYSDHMTHVAGTIAAWGYNSSAQGMAPRSWIRALIQQSTSDLTTYSMATPGQQMATNNPITGNPQLRSVVGNTSLGTADPNTSYDSTSATYDTILRDYPYYMHFNSSGNSGDLGYESITGTWKIAKNIMAIGNISGATRDATGLFTGGANIASNSSRGPTKDGRIKPDFVAKGTSVTSSTGTTAYSSYSGTSMASPNAAGSVALLMDYVRLRLPQQYLRSSTYRALLAATADDRGNPGPDYTYGWGILNVHSAAKIVREQADNPYLRMIMEESLAPGQTWTETYASDGTKPIRVSMSWLDPASTNTDAASRASRLVNDLDVRLIGPDSTEYMPFVMPFVTGQGGTPAFDPSLYNANAVSGDNITDPLELVYLAAPAPGSYTVRVTHKGNLLNNLAQPFSVAVSGLSNSPPTMEVARDGSTMDANGVYGISSTSAGNGTQLTYVISNLGDDTLELTTPVTISNPSNCSVTVNTQPNATVPRTQSTNLVLTVTPTAGGTWSFGISVASNDPFQNPFPWTVTGVAGSATEATFTPDADTYINSASAGSNYGSDTLFSIWNRAAGGSGNFRYGLLRFDLSTIPEGTTITSAKLDFVQNNNVAGAVEIYEATGLWKELNTTGQSDGASWTNSSGLIGATLYGSANAPGTAEGIVPSIQLNESGLAKIQNWVNTSSSNYGFSVKTTNAGNGGNIDLRSREHPTTAHHPRLTVTYDGGVATAPLMVVTDAEGYLPDGGTRTLPGTIIGTASQMTSTIVNLGDSELTLTTPVTVTPVANCSISVTSQPASLVAPSGSTDLVLSITPTAVGPWSASVSIASNDADKSPYTWTINGTAIGYYAITYLGNANDGGTPPSDPGSPYLQGTTVTVRGNTGALTKNGFSFAGWNTAANGTGTTFSPGTTFPMPGNTLTLHAIWNAKPTVDAGPPQTVTLTAGSSEPGLYYGTVSGTTINVTTPNPNTLRITNVAAYTEDSIAANTTETYTGQIYDADGKISFTENIDDHTRIWIDGNLVLSSDSWSNRASTANLNLSPGWHDIEIRIFNGTGGSGPVSSPGIGYDPAGGTAWQTLVDPGDGSFLRVYVPDTATVDLNGTITDAESNPVTTTWTVADTNPADLTATFGNASTIDTTATFTEAGTYTLRLSANDGFGSASADVIIAVNPPSVDRTLTYAGNGSTGGTAPVDPASPYADGSTVTVLGAGDLVKTGHNFAGWNTSTGGGGTPYATGATFTINANITLYAQWTPNIYTVTFDPNGGEPPSPTSKQVTYGSTYGTLATASRTGYSFDGWFTAASGGSEVTSDSSVTITADQTLYAQWTLIPVSVVTSTNAVGVPEGGTTTFQIKLSNQPVGNTTVTVARSSGDADIAVLSGGTLSFTTANWDTYQTVTLAAAIDGDALNGAATISCTPSDPAFITAQVTATEIDKDTTLTVVSGGNGTTTPSGALIVQKGAATALVATPADGYDFANWTVTSGSAQLANANAATTTATLSAPATVQANFNIRQYTLSYTAGVGGTISGASPQTVDHGADGTQVTAVSNPGYTFVKWSDNLTTESRTDTNVTSNLSVSAEFSPNTYSVTFDANGGDAPAPGTKQVTFGAAYGALATTTRAYHTFDGWFTAAEGGAEVTAETLVAIDSDHTLYAQWTPDTYVVSYHGNGNTTGTAPANGEKVHDVDLVLATNSGNLTKTGYSFAGWNTNADGTGTDYAAGATYSANAPLTLYAKWIAGADGTWIQTAAGPYDWGTSGNWNASIVASGADGSASFTPNITVNQTVNLDAPYTIGNITFTDSSSSHNLTISGANALTLSRTSGTPVIDVTQSGRTLTISSQISGLDGLQKNGAGILTLSGTNDYSGGTVINAGRLSIGADANLGASSGTITLNGGELYLNQGSTGISSARDVILNVVPGNQILLQGNQNWNNSGAFTGDGGITFAHSRSGNVSATLTSTSNTFKGALKLNTDNATLTVRMRSLADSAEANGNIIFGARTSSQVFEWDGAAASDNDLILAYRNIEFADNGNASGTIKKTSSTQALSISTGISASGTGSKTLVVDVNGTNNTISGDITDGTGTLSLNKTNGGVLVLSGNNSYTGATTIGNGTLSVNTLADFGANSSIGAATSGAVTIGGTTATGTLIYTGGATSTNRTIKISGWDQANGGGAIIKNHGTGKLTFTAATFNESYTANNATTRPLTLGGTNDGEIQGVIQNGGSNLNIADGFPFLKTSLTKSDGGTWTLSGDNTYSGTTTVNGGKLFINGNQSAATGNVSVSANATLGGTGTLGGHTTIAANGRLEFDISTPSASHNPLDLTSGKTLTFSGASVLTITSSGGASTGDYVLLTAPGGISGSAPATLNLPANWAATVLVIGNDLVLRVTAVPVGDTTPPTLASSAFVDDKSGGAVVVNTLVTYTVSFSEDMDASTVSSADFGNAGTATISIGTVSETTANSGVFTVPVTATGAGTLQLQVNAGAVLQDAAGNNLDNTTAIADNTTIAVQTAYQNWSGGSSPTADANNDGVANSMAWVLGATDPNVDARPLLPTCDSTTDANYLVYTYRRNSAAANAPGTIIAVEYSSTLASWTTAIHDGDNIIISSEDGYYGSGVDKVEVKIKKTLATGGKLFTHLNLQVAP